MGITRKLLSVHTAGLVDFRSDKERTAAYTAGIRREARKQTKMMRQEQRHEQRFVQQAPPPPPAGPPPGFYADPAGHPIQRWWDGVQWTAHWRHPQR